MTSRVAVFDLDRTITRYGTWSPFLLFAARWRAPWRFALIPVILVAMGGYKLHLLSRARLKEIMHAAMIGHRISETNMATLAKQFADHVMATNVYPEALALIQAEQRSGRKVIIATASFQFYADALAERFGVGAVVATQSRRDRNWLTNRISGQNCYGLTKRQMVDDYFRLHGLDRSQMHIRFYSDDLSDLPTFAWADEPVAVNPSRKLAWHAMRNGWSILDWRQKDLRTKNPSRASSRPDDVPIKVVSLRASR